VEKRIALVAWKQKKISTKKEEEKTNEKTE